MAHVKVTYSSVVIRGIADGVGADDKTKANDRFRTKLSNSMVSLASFRLDDEDRTDDADDEEMQLPLHQAIYRLMLSTFCGFEPKRYSSVTESRGPSGFKRNLGSYAGVFAPVSLGQFGNLLFLRAGESYFSF